MDETPNTMREELQRKLEEMEAERDGLVDDPNDYANGKAIKILNEQIASIKGQIDLLIVKKTSKEVGKKALEKLKAMLN